MVHAKSFKLETMGWFALIFSVSIIVVWIRTQTVRDTYRYVHQEKEWNRLQEEVQSLRIKWLRMTSPGRLQRLAESFSLRPPQVDQVVRLKPSMDLTVVKTK